MSSPLAPLIFASIHLRSARGSMFAYVHRSNWMSCHFVWLSLFPSLPHWLVTLDKLFLWLNVNFSHNFHMENLFDFSSAFDKCPGIILVTHLSQHPGFSSHFLIALCNNNYQCKPREFSTWCLAFHRRWSEEFSFYVCIHESAAAKKMPRVKIINKIKRS